MCSTWRQCQRVRNSVRPPQVREELLCWSLAPLCYLSWRKNRRYELKSHPRPCEYGPPHPSHTHKAGHNMPFKSDLAPKSLTCPDDNVAADDVALRFKGEGSVPPPELPFQQDQGGRLAELRGWTPLSPGVNARSSRPASSNPGAHEKCNTVSFAPDFKERRPITRMPSVSAFAKRRSTDGQIGYDDSELMQLEMTDSRWPPPCSCHSLAVNNCHMLKFMAASGIMQGRREEVVVPHRLSFLQQALSGKSPSDSQDLHGSFPVVSRLKSDSSGTSIGASRRPRLLGRSDSKLVVVTEAKPRGTLTVIRMSQSLIAFSACMVKTYVIQRSASCS